MKKHKNNKDIKKSTTLVNQTKELYLPSPITKYEILLAVILALLIFIIYIPAIKGDFIWDDAPAVKANSLIKTSDGLWKIWTQPSANQDEVHYWPIVYTVFWTEYHLWGLNAIGYHLVNVFLHIVNTLLLWLLLRRIFIRDSFFAAAIFGVHPVHIESVAWIVELKDVLSGMFYLLTFLLYVKFIERKKWGTYSFSILFFIFGMLSKSMVMSLPIALLLFVWWKQDALNKKTLFPLIPLFIIAVGIASADVWIAKSRKEFNFGLSSIDRCLIAGRAVWFYLGKLFFPVDLIAMYPRWQINTHSLLSYFYPFSALFVIIFLWIKRNIFGKEPFIAVAFFIVTLAPTLGFINHGFMFYSFVADRFQYLASIGLIILFVGIISKCILYIKNSHTLMLIRYGGTFIIVLLLSILTWEQSSVYKNNISFFEHTLSVNPNAAHAHLSLGYELYNKGDIEQAIKHYSNAVDILPGYANAHHSLGVIFSRMGKIEDAITHYRMALKINPQMTDVAVNLAWILATNKEEKFRNGKEAIYLVENASNSINNTSPKLLDALAAAYAEEGKFDSAKNIAEKAITLARAKGDVSLTQSIQRHMDNYVKNLPIRE